MFQARAIETSDKPALYRDLAQQLEGLLHGETDAVANASNTAAIEAIAELYVMASAEL